MSDFYRRRRTAIKDTCALFAFFLGMTWSAPVAWPYLDLGVTHGNMTRGIAAFVAVVLAIALTAGVCGLALGACGGLLWERRHRAHRITHES